MHRLFYNYQVLGDVLLIVFDNEKIPDRTEKRNATVVLYNNDKIVGINIFDISAIVRIKAGGAIMNPAPEFLDVINHILINDGLEPLPEQSGSGFVVGQVLDVINDPGRPSLAKIDIGSRVIYAETKREKIPLYSLVVVALPETILLNGKTAKVRELGGVYCEGRLCLKGDINAIDYQDAEDVFFIDGQYVVGQDFFISQEVVHGT